MEQVKQNVTPNPSLPKSVRFRQDEWDEIDEAAAKTGQSRHSFMRASIMKAVEET